MSSHVVPHTAGVCLVRDAIDILPYLCGHYLRLGFERLHFVDDGSSDGSYEYLEQLSRKTSRVRVERIVHNELQQRSLVNTAINRLIESGSRLIFPFDADEFWQLSARRLRRLAASPQPRMFNAHWRNFVQRRERRHPQPLGLLSAGYMAPVRHDIGMDDVQNFREPFVCTTMAKVAFWSDQPVDLMVGQHGLETGKLPHDPTPIGLLHLPIRWKSELTKRALNYEPRRAAMRQGSGQSWQSRFHADILQNGRQPAVWAANSADANGCLDVYGRSVKLRRDPRLQWLLLRGLLHMVRYRWMRLPAGKPKSASAVNAPVAAKQKQKQKQKQNSNTSPNR